jgi:DNA repair exonuclease SbcCD ATPase subunit
MPSTSDYLEMIQKQESRAENLRKIITSLKDAQKEHKARSLERKKINNKLTEAKADLKELKELLRKNKRLLKEESMIEIRREREGARVGRPPAGSESQGKPKRGRPRKDKGVVVEKGKRGRPRKEVVELSSFRKEVEGLRIDMNLMNAKLDRMALLIQQLAKRKG